MISFQREITAKSTGLHWRWKIGKHCARLFFRVQILSCNVFLSAALRSVWGHLTQICVSTLCTRACRRVQCIERSNFTLLWPRQSYWPPTVRPALCSNDYWLLIDSFINCELLWLVPYRRVHAKTSSAGFLRPWRGRGWAAAAETDHRSEIKSSPVKTLQRRSWFPSDCTECCEPLWGGLTHWLTTISHSEWSLSSETGNIPTMFMSPWSKYFNISLTCMGDVNQVTVKLCLLYRAVSFLSFAAFFMHLCTVSIFWESGWRTTRLPVWWNYNMRARSIQMRLCTFTYVHFVHLYMIYTW